MVEAAPETLPATPAAPSLGDEASNGAPARPLRLLVIEDSEDDALLLVADLEAAGYTVHAVRVESADEMRSALDDGTWDAVISDETMPRFSAAAALRLLQGRKLDLPFLIVSGTISEERAVAAMKAGAHDYFVKGNHSRLIPAIERELRDAADRRARRAAEAALRQAEADRLLQQAKEDLIATVSHELRTPLATMLGATELLETGDVGEVQHAQLVGVILKEGRRLKALIDNFLDLQHIEGGWHAPRLVATDLRRIVERALEMVGPDAARPIALDLPAGLPPVLVDADQLLHVLENLLSNARKYSPQGGAIHVHARTALAVEGELAVEVSVRDTGMGIPAESLPHLFEKFFRVDDEQRRTIPGTGLGLAICRKIVAAHHGQIWAESAGPGQGSIFTFTLPAAGAVSS